MASHFHFEHTNLPVLDVLIVEDEPTARRALCLLLSAHGYQTAAVSSAEDALARVSVGDIPRIALVDLDLPGMNGMELIRRLEVLSPTIYPVLVTAADRDLAHRGRISGRLGYVQKPIDFMQLLSLIDDEEA